MNNTDNLDPRFQGRTNTKDERYNISNRNIYSSNWGVATLTRAERLRLQTIAVIADNNGSLEALGYELYGYDRYIKHRGNGMTAKSRIALIALIAANERFG